MEAQKNYLFVSRRVIASVDFLKWTSTFGEESIRQIETPMRGVQLAPALSELFGFARDDLGLMLAMDEAEAPWLAHLPIVAALHGYDDRSSLLLITESVPVMDTTIPSVGIEIYVPLARHALLTNESLLGFSLIRQGKPERVGRIVTLHTPDSWRTHQERNRKRASASGSLFAGA